MARTYLVFGDIEGKLDVPRVECDRCKRKPRDVVPCRHELAVELRHALCRPCVSNWSNRAVPEYGGLKPFGVMLGFDRSGAPLAEDAWHARYSDCHNHICWFAPVKRWRACRWHLVRSIRRDTWRDELRLLFVLAMRGSAFRQRRVLLPKPIHSLRLCGTTAAALSTRPLK